MEWTMSNGSSLLNHAGHSKRQPNGTSNFKPADVVLKIRTEPEFQLQNIFSSEDSKPKRNASFDGREKTWQREGEHAIPGAGLPRGNPSSGHDGGIVRDRVGDDSSLTNENREVPKTHNDSETKGSADGRSSSANINERNIVEGEDESIPERDSTHGRISIIPRSSYGSPEFSPVAGPSSAGAGIYRTGDYAPQRRSRVYLPGSTTSFIDVTEEIEDVSQHPVSEGGFCDIYRAMMKGEGRVALKKLRLLGSFEKARKRFRYEAEVWFRLDHPNVLKFYGICTIGETMYMVSPWQENGHLSAYLRLRPNEDRLRLLYQVANALDYLHNHEPKIIHGDIKGPNILISPDGNALLCDFGLSMVLSEIAIMSGVPTGVNDGGSIRYMANELMTDGQSKTEASDAYAFAMLMVEILTCSPPYAELQNDVAVINAVVSGRRPPSPFAAATQESPLCVEQRLWRLMQICWHSNHRVRPNMCDVKFCLRMIIDDSTYPPSENRALGVAPIHLRKYVMRNEITLAECAKRTLAPLREPVERIRFRHRLILPWVFTTNIVIMACSVVQISILSILLRDPLLESASIMFRITIPSIGLVISSFNFAMTGMHWIIFILTLFFRAPMGFRNFFRRFSPSSYLQRVVWNYTIVSYIGSLPNALLMTISSHTGRFHRPHSGRIPVLSNTYEALCWLVWLLLLTLMAYRLYGRYHQYRRRANIGAGESTQQLSRLDTEEQARDKHRGEGGTGEKQKHREKARRRTQSMSRSPPRTSLDDEGEQILFPNVPLRLRNGLPSESYPALTSVDDSTGTRSGLTNSLKKIFLSKRGKGTTVPLTPQSPPPGAFTTPSAEIGEVQGAAGPCVETEQCTSDRRSVMSARQHEKQPRREQV